MGVCYVVWLSICSIEKVCLNKAHPTVHPLLPDKPTEPIHASLTVGVRLSIDATDKADRQAMLLRY